MADTLVTKSGAPYNIVKENGRWYFTSALFPQSYRSLPKELRLVPKEMIPGTFNAGGNTAYVPESAIATYYKGNEFQQTFNSWAGATYRAMPGSSVTITDPITRQSLQLSAKSFATTVETSLAKFNEQDRVNKSAAFTPTIKNAKTVLPTGWMGAIAETSNIASTNAVTAAMQKVGKDPAYNYFQGQIIDKNSVAFLFLPDKKGKIQMQAESSFQADFARSDPTEIKKWQKAIGSPIVDGILKPDEMKKFILPYARLASVQNFSSLQKGIKGFKPLDALKYTQQYTSALKAASAAQSNIGRPITTTTKQAEDFTPEWVSSTLNGYFQQYLGMDAPAAMVKKFTQELQKKAKANPATQKSTTTQLDEAGNATRTVQNTSGFGQEQAAQLAMQKAKSQPGTVGYQAATRYMDVIMKMIQNPVG